MLLFGFVVFAIVFIYFLSISSPGAVPGQAEAEAVRAEAYYAYQENYWRYNESVSEYEFMLISDMDKMSKEGEKTWVGVMKGGVLVRDHDGAYQVQWKFEKKLKSAYNEAGRGMELSELTYFNGKLLTCDDRTGIIFEILVEETIVVPRFVFTTGDGNTDKGFKCEWMTVVHDKLFVGSIGKEFTTNGKIENLGSQWIKTIDTQGRVEHIFWREKYEELRKHLKVEYPAYMVHEAIMWEPRKKHWVVLPRRYSTEPYDEKLDEEKGTNIFLLASPDFKRIETGEIGKFDPLKGTSSFKFVPFREGEILQLKTIEAGDTVESYLSVVNLNTGKVLMEDIKVGDVKFEGVEFI
uniref:Apyrase n=1 Tax=Arcella intermedia TaxID=1963864 RepID=A0A6B2L8E4_9EUKA